MSDQVNESTVAVENFETYAQAAALYNEGKKDEAVELIRTEIGEEAAQEAATVMNEADAQREAAGAQTDEATADSE